MWGGGATAILSQCKDVAVAQVQQAVEKLASSPASHSAAVNDLSEEVWQKLHCVQSCLIEVKKISDLKELLCFVSGQWIFLLLWFTILSFITDHHFSASISKLDIIIQITAVLGIICTIIMDISCRGRDFIMSLVNVILFLAFQQPDGILQSCYEDIISEMPQSVNVALMPCMPLYIHASFQTRFCYPSLCWILHQPSSSRISQILWSLTLQGDNSKVTFLNIEGMCICGAKSSVGLISMIYFNLSPAIHYKPESMYVVGIVPGPKHPSITELNPHVEPLMDQLVQSWHRVTQFSCTAHHPLGWLTCSAVAAAVMDLPPACHTSQLAPFSGHHFCAVCQCYHVLNLNRIDHTNWREWDNDTLFRHTEE